MSTNRTDLASVVSHAESHAPVIHLCPERGEPTMPCCGRPPLERLGDRMTVDATKVTCPGRPAQEPRPLPTRIQYAHGGGRFHRGNHLLADYFDRETGDLIERAFEAEARTPPAAPPLDVERLAEAYANVEGAGVWTAEEGRIPASWVYRRAEKIAAEYARLQPGDGEGTGE